MSEVSIRFRACKGSPHIEQQTPYCQSILSTCRDAAAGLTIIGVTVNGRPLKFRVMPDGRVAVSPPIPFEWDYVALRCTGPQEPLQPLQWPPATYPAPDHSYGLTAPGARGAAAVARAKA